MWASDSSSASAAKMHIGLSFQNLLHLSGGSCEAFPGGLSETFLAEERPRSTPRKVRREEGGVFGAFGTENRKKGGGAKQGGDRVL